MKTCTNCEKIKADADGQIKFLISQLQKFAYTVYPFVPPKLMEDLLRGAGFSEHLINDYFICAKQMYEEYSKKKDNKTVH